MIKVKTIQTLTLSDGLIELSKDQARIRSHVLDVIDSDKGIYKPKSMLFFKAGEEIGLESLSKINIQKVEILDAPKEQSEKEKTIQVESVSSPGEEIGLEKATVGRPKRGGRR